MKAIRVLLFGIVGALVICGVVARFANPELTETQLVLRFWWLWVATALAAFAAAWCPAPRRRFNRGGGDGAP